MTDDVRDLLGKAFGQEPPLRIDRDEVIQQGRKRLRRRRVFEAGSVVAAVLVVAVGAVTLTNLAGSEQQKKMPPAASSTMVAPPGPVLPLPTTSGPASATITNAPSSAPSLTTVLTPPPSFPSRYQLTDLLYNSGVVMEKDVAPVGSPPRVPEFHLQGAQYVYEADIIRPDRPGFLQVTIDFTVRTAVSCDTVPAGFGSCTTEYKKGVPVTVSDWRGDDGERRLLVITVLADGTRVAALSSNMPSQFRKDGRVPDKAMPPTLDSDELCLLVAKVGLSAR